MKRLQRIVIIATLASLFLSCDTFEEQDFSECKIRTDLEMTALDADTNRSIYTRCRYRYYSETTDHGILIAGGESIDDIIVQIAPAGNDNIAFNRPEQNYLTVVANFTNDGDTLFTTGDFGIERGKLSVENIRYKLRKKKHQIRKKHNKLNKKDKNSHKK